MRCTELSLCQATTGEKPEDKTSLFISSKKGTHGAWENHDNLCKNYDFMDALELQFDPSDVVVAAS